MKIINPTKSIIVFDLDDTLYSEHEYKLSGIRSVIRLISDLYSSWTIEELENAVKKDEHNWLDALCQYCYFNDSEKNTLLWQYRLHQPNIHPYISSHDFSELITDFIATALITDGRSITQRLKLQSLGIHNLFDDVLISEAYRSEKPCAERFEYIENKYSRENSKFIYIGDNIKKDFITPKLMGWLTIGLEASENNIHINDPNDFTSEYHPHFWIKSLDKLSDFIIK
ncbi:HAD family hydrolase [Neisseria yangbaofengii]|uniref:HAD family hydrolase n=1 Tax=Neisseria yangbaofengii TaxID=2709396 RepID=UPI0013ED5E8C|nr:HAD family hydrolase [Neisseria yangbaofengii]